MATQSTEPHPAPPTMGHHEVVKRMWCGSSGGTYMKKSLDLVSVHSFIHSTNKHLLSTSYVPGTLLCPGDTAMNRTDPVGLPVTAD